jgi:hypothetical protein
MIGMKSVRGPAIYDFTNGYDIKVGNFQNIGTSSGKMVIVHVTSSSQFMFLPVSLSGPIVTVKAYNGASGLLVATTSADFSSVEIAVVADGY